jgi:hypothetical protein
MDLTGGWSDLGGYLEFAVGRNPFFGQPGLENPVTYLAGGRDFGPLVPDPPDILSRNLTPLTGS